MTSFATAVSILIGLIILYFGIRKWKSGSLTNRLAGKVLLLYGLYFAFFTGTATSLVLPGIGSIGLGAATGGVVGYAASAIIGTIGVVTGGIGIALGALGMTLIGALLGAIGASSGGFGLKTSVVFLVTPWFWAPLVLIGLYLVISSRKSKDN